MSVYHQLCFNCTFLSVIWFVPSFVSVNGTAARISPFLDLIMFLLLQVKWIEQQVAKKRVKRDIEIKDPKWSAMWYLVSTFCVLIMLYSKLHAPKHVDE